jgi:TPR repeat protein
MSRLAIGIIAAGTVLTVGTARADLAADTKACNAGNGGKCEEIAERYHMGFEGAKDPKKAEELRKQLDKADATAEQKKDALQQLDKIVDKKKAFEFLTKACDLKAARACNNLGTAWSEGKDGATKVDHAKAGALYKKACELKHGLGCFNLGNVYRLGEGVKIDLKVALENFHTSCEMSEAKGCTEEAIMYYEGKATKKDVPKAKELLDKACKLGSQTACKNAELLKNAK